MPYTADTKEIRTWAEGAQLENITYHRTRQQLWAAFATHLRRGGGLPIPNALFNSIKSALTCRSDGLDDNKRLAFDTALQTILDTTEPHAPAQP